MIDFTKAMIEFFGFKTKEELIKGLYLASIKDAYPRIDKSLRLEEKIRDAFIRDLETVNPLTQDLLENRLLILTWERHVNLSDSEKKRLDVCFSIPGFDFVIECKRLTSANQLYLDEGLMRFISGQYAHKDNFAGMLGFIIQGKPKEIVNKLKEKIRELHPHPQMNKLLDTKVLDWELSFQSKHIRFNETPIHLYHLFFDFTEND